MDPRPIFFYLFLGILVLTTWLQIYRRPLAARLASRIFLYSSGFALAYLIWIGFLQFRAFQSGVLGLTLGTRETFLWFLGYTRLHFWNEYLLSLPVAVLFALIALYFNKRYHERFFENEELYLIALGILLVGYPGFIFYIPLVLLISIVTSLIFVRRGGRLPLYHFWAPVAAAALLIAHFWASSQGWWAAFRF